MSDTSMNDTTVEQEVTEPVEQKPKAKRTRAKKAAVVETTEEEETQAASQEPEAPVKRGRGRPKKVVDPNAPPKPKRKCSEKQLAALAAGRAKNSRFHPKAKPAEQEAEE